MKILQINKFYFDQGGAEHYIFGLIDLLEKQGHKVIPFAMQHSKNVASEYAKYFPSFIETLSPNSVKEKLRTAGRMFYSFEAKKKLSELICQTKPDIAHLHNIYHQLSPSILTVLKKHKIPVVMTVHDYKLVCPNYILYTKGAVCRRCLGGRYYQAVVNKCLKNSYSASCLAALEMYFHKLIKIYQKNIDLLIAPSEFVKNILVEFGFSPQKITVLPHFVDLPKVESQNNSVDKYFLYIGRLKQEKGIDILIKAMSKLPDAKLKIAGSGPDLKVLKKQVQELQLRNVEFLGQCRRKQVIELYKNTLATVVPSRVWETFGLVAAESLAQARPAIAARIGALPEIVTDNQTGLLFEVENKNDLAEKIKQILNSHENAEQMGKNGQKIVAEKLNSEKHYQSLINIYQNLYEDARQK